MIKKILILITLTIIISSCGKKGDPVFQEKNQNTGKINVQINLFS